MQRVTCNKLDICVIADAGSRINGIQAEKTHLTKIYIFEFLNTLHSKVNVSLSVMVHWRMEM